MAALLYWALGRRKAPIEVASYASVFVPSFALASLTAPGMLAAGHTVMPAPAGIAIVAQVAFFPQAWPITIWNVSSILLLCLVIGSIAIQTGQKVIRRG